MKSKVLGALAFGLLVASASSQAGTIWSVNGHEYEVVNSERITWTAANAALQGTGWHLATVGSVEENDFIKSLLDATLASRSHYWLGGTDQGVEGTYVWIDGTPFSYTNWWAGEPNNAGNEDFIAMDLRSGAWAWNDAPDNVGSTYGFARGYIMERIPGVRVPEPGTLALLGLGLAGLGLSRRRKAG